VNRFKLLAGGAAATSASTPASSTSERQSLSRQSSLLLSMAALMGNQFRAQSAKERRRFWCDRAPVAVLWS
jgi:hypothetical protein